jgi:hypothetical protein
VAAALVPILVDTLVPLWYLIFMFKVAEVVRVMSEDGASVLWIGAIVEVKGHAVRVFCNGRTPQWVNVERVLPRKSVMS